MNITIEIKFESFSFEKFNKIIEELKTLTNKIDPKSVSIGLKTNIKIA